MKKSKQNQKKEAKNKQLVYLALLSALLIVLASGIIAFTKPLSSETYSSPDTPINELQLSPTTAENQIVTDTLGFDPTNPAGKIEDIRNKYLAREWNKIISNTSVIGPIHKYFLAHPLPFKIIFNTPYTFTPTFLLIVFLWIYFGFLTKDIMSFTAYDKNVGLIVGLLAPFFFAHIGLLNIVSTFFVNLVISKDKWWVRWIIGLLVAGALFVFFKFEGGISKLVQGINAGAEKEKLESKIEKSDQFVNEFTKGTKIVK
ncbi:MAG: hypothetical protein AABX11_02035 [Nanoarchaeota archaeon]